MERLRDRYGLISISISKSEIESNDFTAPISLLNEILSDKEDTKYFFEKIDLGVNGYDDDPRELFEIKEVKNYIQQFDRMFPYCFYFFIKAKYAGLALVFLCCCDASLNNSQVTFDTALMEKFLISHYSAMNEICFKVGIKGDELKALTSNVLNYFNNM